MKAKLLIRQTFAAVFVGMSIVLVMLAISGFVPGVWLCDIASQLRLLYLIVFLVFSLFLLLLRSRIGLMIVAAGFVLNAWPIVGLLAKPSCTITGDTHEISILNFNSEFQHNEHFELLQDLISQRNPDFVALVEVDKKWIDAIQETTKRYPFSKIVIAGPGMALFSKFPLEHCEVRYFGRSHHPRIIATARVGTQSISMVIAHPTTPKSSSGYRERNQEIALLREEIKQMPNPKVLIGDLNCGPWSSAFTDLLTAGLHDSEQGFGPQPSWPARSGRVIDHVPIPPIVPIDHVLTGDSIGVLERVTGPPMQSDHLPVFVRCAMAK